MTLDDGGRARVTRELKDLGERQVPDGLLKTDSFVEHGESSTTGFPTGQLLFFGSPVTPRFCNVFHLARSEVRRQTITAIFFSPMSPQGKTE